MVAVGRQFANKAVPPVNGAAAPTKATLLAGIFRLTIFPILSIVRVNEPVVAPPDVKVHVAV